MPKFITQIVDLMVNPVSRGIILELGCSLFLLILVVAMVFGWKPKLTMKKVLIRGAILLSSGIAFLLLSQEYEVELYLKLIFFIGAPIVWLAAWCKNKDKNFAGLLTVITAVWMTGFLEFGAVHRNYVTTLLLPLILVPCFQCWRDPKEEGFIRTKLWHWKIVAGSLVVIPTLIVLVAATGWEKIMISSYIKEHQYVLLASAVLIFFIKAIPEELIYRGIFQGTLKDKFGFFPALIGSSLLFGASYLNDPAAWVFPNWHAMINAIVLGIACGAIYNRTRSIAISAMVNASASFMWWVMFAHGGY